MLQVTNITASAPYYPSSSVNVTYAYSATQNNGKVISQTDNISGEQVEYTYDALNRLATAEATSGSWGQSYSYDGFGNLTAQNVIAGSAPSYSATPNPATNQTWTSDANGNALLLGSSYPYYDVTNRFLGNVVFTGLQPGSYAYSYAPGNKQVWRGVCCGSDGDGNPIMSTDEVAYWSITGEKLTTYQLSGEGVAQEAYTPAPTLSATQTATWYYFGSKMIKNAGGYVVADRLGSIGHFYPYGQEKPSATQNGTEKFTGYLRDAETGNDYAINRYHVPGTGRFLTPDPYLNSAGLTDPGSWNRYSYVGGDPVNRIDPDGEEWCDPDEISGQAPPRCDPNDDTGCCFANCDPGGVAGGTPPPLPSPEPTPNPPVGTGGSTCDPTAVVAAFIGLPPPTTDKPCGPPVVTAGSGSGNCAAALAQLGSAIGNLVSCLNDSCNKS